MSNPPPGWYDNPAAPGSGQRYWDGVAWTGHFSAGAGQVKRPNEHALAFALMFGGIAWVGLLVLLTPRIDRDPSYVGGGLLVPTMGVAVVVGLLARRSSRRLGWWVNAAVVPLAAVLALIPSADDLMAAADNEASRGVEVGLLSAPAAGQGWTVVDTPDTRADVRRVVDSMATEVGIDAETVAGYYLHESAPNTPVLFAGINGDLDKGASASESLTSILRGAFVKTPQSFEPGDTGGALGCGQGAAQGMTWVSCAWVGNHRAVLMRWNDESVTLEQAAELSRELRDLSLS